MMPDRMISSTFQMKNNNQKGSEDAMFVDLSFAWMAHNLVVGGCVS